VPPKENASSAQSQYLRNGEALIGITFGETMLVKRAESSGLFGSEPVRGAICSMTEINCWREAIFGVLLTVALLVGCCPLTDSTSAAPARKASDYPWPKTEESYTPLAGRFPPPAGFQRSPVAEGSWKQWLRNLPMRRVGTPVRSRGGAIILPANSTMLAGVVDLDI